MQLQVATIPPVSLLKYSAFSQSRYGNFYTTFTEKEYAMQQNLLEEHIKYINNAICVLNKSKNLRTIRWDRDLMKSTTRKRGKYMTNKNKITKFAYNHLYDGVHPDDHLQHHWYRVMCQSIVTDICENSLYPPSSSEDEDDHQMDTWDFKRNKLA
jgi:hypothetical protein